MTYRIECFDPALRRPFARDTVKRIHIPNAAFGRFLAEATRS